ncbi:hypothetical protein DsansV1_C03g0030221 [Dioscorea sansibarensis]
MENHKWFCMHSLHFRHRCGSSATELLEKCLLAMKGLDIDVRSCYSDPLFEYLDAQNTLFRNLIAFEQFYPDTRTYITIYAAFMACIIEAPNDVQLLHLNGILSNRPSTDELRLIFSTNCATRCIMLLIGTIFMNCLLM